MNTRFRNLGTTAGLSAAALFLAAGAAFGAITATVDDTNRGPGAPIANDADPALFVAYPRQIADPDVAFPSTDLFSEADASADMATLANDLRTRSIAAISGPSGALVNPELAFGAINIGAGVPVAANSYIIFFNEGDITDFDDATEFYDIIANNADQVATLDLIFNEATGAVVADDDLDIDGVGNDIDNDLVRLRVVGADSIDAAVDGYENFEYAIIVLADGATVNDALFWSELIAVDQNPDPVQATQVVLGEDSGGGGFASIYMVLNYQIVDDYDGGVANLPDSPIDTTITDFIGIEGTSFDIRVTGQAMFESLGDFLADTDVFTDVPGIAGVQISQNDEFNTILEIVLDQQFGAGAGEIDDDERAEIQDRELKFGNTAPVTSITALTKSVSTGTYLEIGDAGDVGITGGQLLQGTGQLGFGAGTRAIWVAIDLDSDLASAGDNNQFELVDGDGNVIATSDTVQFGLPGAGAVPGIDDDDLDGTADDNVIEEATNRLFARFVLADGNDAINSDATWSDDGQADIDNRDERESFSVQVNEAFGGTTAQTALSGSLTLGATAGVTDLARPIAIGFLTRAGDTGEFCEFVDTLDFIFDETIATDANTSTNVFLGYNSGATISDLTAGLGAGLTIPTIDIVTTATVNDRRLTATSLNLITNFVNNDTAELGAPVVPVDGTANDGSTAILTGTGDLGYIIAHLDGAVTDTGGRGATAVGTFNMDDELTGGFEVVEDGAAPALMGANVNDGLSDVLAGFSENVTNVLNEEDESESFFVIMENDSVGRRFNLEGSPVDFNGDNTVDILIDGVLDEDVSLDPGYNLSVFNPGFPIADGAGNESDPNITKTKMVLITPPAAAFMETGVAIVDDDSDKVIEIRLMVTGPVELSEDGVISELADRFFLRGDDNGGQGDNDGQGMQLGGLIEDIEIGDTPNADGSYTITLVLMEGMPFPQEDFYVEYLDSNDLESPADSFLVTPVETGDVEIASADIYVSVLRPPSLENGAEGNPLTMTIVGEVDLGDVNSLGTRVTAYVWEADEGVGTFSFVYKGVVHEGNIDEVADGEVRYFHPQLLGDGLGAVEPMGIINRKPELDITATVTLTREGEENGDDTDIEQEVFVYQNLENLNSASVIKPLRITFRDDTSCPGRFTFNGSGISNGTVTYPGAFEEIGSTLVNGPVLGGDDDEEIGPRAYTLHTRGEKSFAGLPVVLVVEPEDFFAPDASAFLANNFLFPVASAPAMRALTFSSDIDRTGANALPIVFNIDSEMVTPFALGDYEQDDWAILPVPTNQGDRGATNVLPNRVSASNTPVTLQANIPASISARGAFVVLNTLNNPELLDIDLALALDSRGVFCGDVCNLNRVATGYAYALEADNLNGRTWFTYGPRFSSGATLSVVSNNSNGGWNLLANLRNDPIAAGSFGGQVNITMTDEAGVRVWASGFGDTNDLEEIGVNQGVLVNTTAPFNSTP